MKKSRLYFNALAIVAILTLTAAFPVRAQSSSSEELTIQPSAADRDAVQAATLRYRHANAANNAAGQALRARQIAEQNPPRDATSAWSGNGTILQYAGDVADGGGKVMQTAVSHAIYLQMQAGGSCTIATCWGDPEGYLRDLGLSDFIHVIDQYVRRFDANRYTVGFHATVNDAAPAAALHDSDIQAIVHAAAAKSGASGYGHIYHVFLPPGQDECFDSTLSECYSPDNPATFYFCAYHSSVDFPDIGHLIYTVQPYANIAGCQVFPGTPNGSLVDSANNALSHEMFESITDPDGDAWTNTDSLNMLGSEIADECEFAEHDGSGFYVPTFLIGARIYAVQLVYSNEQHACSSAP